MGGDFTKFQTFKNRGFICNLILTNSCDCLFDGNITQNTKKLQKLMRSYQKINDELAKYFTKGDFVVETLPALLGLPPQIRRGRGSSVEVDRQAYTHDCLHYTGKTQG